MRLLAGVVLAVVLANLAPSLAQAQKKAVAPAAVQKEFNDFLSKFRVALKANDSTAVASMARFPFETDDSDSIRGPAQFRAKIYLPKLAANRACLQRGKAVYDRDGKNNDNYFISCGELIFTFTKAPAGFLFTGTGVND